MIGDERFPTTEGKSKKEAKDKSAVQALKTIKNRMKQSIPKEVVSLFDQYYFNRYRSSLFLTHD